MPENTAASTVGQDCKDAVSDGSGLQRRFRKLPGSPTLLCGSSHRRELLTSLQPAVCVCAASGAAGPPGARGSEGGRGLRVAASGSYGRIATSTPVPGPKERRAAGSMEQPYRDCRQRRRCPAPRRCVCYQERTSRPRVQERASHPCASAKHFSFGF
uniref:Uncharacterized protein n=1 Tax=Rangifer tarandus platyrhynchus TaxID=3082113 RepID=A0ACB0EPG1_RANTA|nr:unnamed protein product [Rangifer tarandus platyrhynchus]